MNRQEDIFAVTLVSYPALDYDGPGWSPDNGPVAAEDYYKLFYITIRNGMPRYLTETELLKYDLEIPFKTILQKPWHRSDIDWTGTALTKYPSEDVVDYFDNCQTVAYLAELYISSLSERFYELPGGLQLRLFTTRSAVLAETGHDRKITYYNSTDSWVDVIEGFTYNSTYNDPLESGYASWEEPPGPNVVHAQGTTYKYLWRSYSKEIYPQWILDKYYDVPIEEYHDVREEYVTFQQSDLPWSPPGVGWYTIHWARDINSWPTTKTCPQDKNNLHEVQYDTLETIDNFYTTEKPNEIATDVIAKGLPYGAIGGNYLDQATGPVDILYDVVNLFIENTRIEKYEDHFKIYIEYGGGAPRAVPEDENDLKYIDTITSQNKWDSRIHGQHLKIDFNGAIEILYEGADIEFPDDENEYIIYDTNLGINKLPLKSFKYVNVGQATSEQGWTRFDEMLDEQTIDWVEKGITVRKSSRIGYSRLLKKVGS